MCYISFTCRNSIFWTTAKDTGALPFLVYEQPYSGAAVRSNRIYEEAERDDRLDTKFKILFSCHNLLKDNISQSTLKLMIATRCLCRQWSFPSKQTFASSFLCHNHPAICVALEIPERDKREKSTRSVIS